jgi:hypothetical protein
MSLRISKLNTNPGEREHKKKEKKAKDKQHGFKTYYLFLFNDLLLCCGKRAEEQQRSRRTTGTKSIATTGGQQQEEGKQFSFAACVDLHVIKVVADGLAPEHEISGAKGGMEMSKNIYFHFTTDEQVRMCECVVCSFLF